jgi:hypothetical protein
LIGTGNAYTVTVANGAVTAAHLNAIDAATTVVVDASAVVTSITGTAAEFATLVTTNTATTTLAGNYAATITGNATVAQANVVDADTLGVVTAAIDAGDLARAEALLNAVTRSRIVQVGIAINSGAIAGATAGASGTIGQQIGASIAAGIAGAKMPSGVGGGGGGGGGGSPAETEANAWDAAIAKAYEYGEVTTQQYIDYLTQRLAGEDRYSDVYFKLWKERQGLEQMLDDQAERRRKDEEAAAKKAADDAEKAAKEAERGIDRVTAAAERSQQALGNLIINVTNTSADPQSVVRAIEQARRMFGNRWLTG